MNSYIIYYNDRILFHPIYYIKETMDNTLFFDLRFDKTKITEIINKSLYKIIDNKTPKELQDMFGISSNYWLNLQKRFYKKYFEAFIEEQEFNDFYSLEYKINRRIKK